MRIIGAFFFALLFVANVSFADPDANKNGRISVHYFLNPVVSPKNIRHAARDCMNNETCGAAVDALAAAWGGVPPGAIKETMDLADRNGFGVSSYAEGEHNHFNIKAAPGYRVCHAYLSNTSAAPATGKYAPQFATTIYPDRVDVTLFVHRLGLGKGRSWFEGTLTVLYSPNSETSSSDCLINSGHQKNFYVCKGASKTSDHDPCYGSYWIPLRN